MSKMVDGEKVDDWDYNATVEIEEKMGSIVSSSGMVKTKFAAMPMMAQRSLKANTLGFSVGGAKDADNFYDNIENGYLPKVDSITYEGVFYDYYFDIGSKEVCKELFCPTYSTAIHKNIFTHKNEHFITVGLDSNINPNHFQRKKLNLVVVLDISGSMGSRFNQYYYDRGKKVKLSKEDLTLSKMKIANRTIVDMMKHLKPDDRFGVVLFDDNAYRAKPLRLVKNTDMKAIEKHILDINDKGGTNWSAGYKKGLELFENVEKNTTYDNRIIFITDAMPNRGELAKDKLFGMIKQSSKNEIYTTVFGVGVDFNANLVEYISKTKGANYFSIHSNEQFKKRLDKEFDYLVTPLVFDLKLSVKSEGFSIDSVYGAPKANLHTGTVLEVDTLFPSDSGQDGVKGGVILVKLKQKVSNKSDLKLRVTYKDGNAKEYSSTKKITFKSGNYYENSGIKKAISLTNYVSVLKNWLVDTRAKCNDEVNYPYPPIHILKQRCMIYPPQRPIYPKMKTWERKSCKLNLSDGYKKLFSVFKDNFDASLIKEYRLVEKLLDNKKSDSSKKDDWEF
jgi:Ca-activated chloride channel family protein